MSAVILSHSRKVSPHLASRNTVDEAGFLMANTTPFDQYSDDYDAWFDQHAREYSLELQAIRDLMPSSGRGLEVGVGSGKFAAPLGIADGLDPSESMLMKADSLGIRVVEGVAEQLPYGDAVFDYVLMVTTICFVDDLRRSFEEASRVLSSGGKLLLGFIDRESTLGQQYMARRGESRFYGIAHFYSTREVLRLLDETGFSDISIRQTLLQDESGPEIIDGYGAGSFVAISATRQG